MPPTFNKGITVIAIITIPIPPNHCSIALHMSIALGALFRSPIIVEPVVVIPDMLSKKASLNVNSRLENMKGKDPKIAIPIQEREVNKNACCKFNYLFWCKFESKKRIPINMVITEE